MKTLLAIILISNTYIIPQTFRLGIKSDFLTGNKYLNYEIGPELVADYSCQAMPFSIQVNTRFYLSELSEENRFSSGYTYTVFGIGTTLNYFPISWPIEPYLGCGIFYNFNDITVSGNSTLINGSVISPNNVGNNFSVEIIGGLKLSANTPINFIVEVTKTINKPGYDLVTSNSDGGITTKRSKFNFDSLFLKLGLLFRI